MLNVAQTPAPRVSIIIPHLNGPELLEHCVAALVAQEPATISREIIVVDNGSRQPPEEVCARFAGVRLETEATPGPGPARNRGAILARGEILAFIDADCLAAPGWLTAIVGYFDTHPEIGFVGGDIGIATRSPKGMTAIEAYEAMYSYRAEMFVRRDGYAATGNMAVRRAVFEAVGPFEGIRVYEDVRWGQAARAMGHGLDFVPDALVRTPACDSYAGLCKRIDRHVAHELAETDLAGMGGAKWVLRGLLMAGSPIAELPWLMTTPRLRGRERWLALGCLASVRLYRAARMFEALFSRRYAGRLATWNR